MKTDFSFKLVTVVVLAGVVLAFSPLASAHHQHHRHQHTANSAVRTRLAGK